MIVRLNSLPMVVLSGAGLSFALFGMSGCGRDASGPDVAARPPAAFVGEIAAGRGAEPERVQVQQVASARLEAVLAVSGSIEARRETASGAEVPGLLEQVFVDVGDEVKLGDLLFQIDSTSYEMALREAEAGLVLARAESANAEAELQRAQQLMERNVVSGQRSDQLRMQSQVATARVTQMQARVARARHDLDRTRVHAPYDASIVERLADEGSLAGTEPILLLQEVRAFEAVLDVPESVPVPVRVGDPVSLIVEGLTDPIESRVARVSQRVDPRTRTYQVRCAVVDSTGLLKAGSYLRAVLRPKRREARAVVDRSALLMRDGRTYLLVVDGGVVRHTRVRAGVVSDEQAEILSGAIVGEWVVFGESVTRLADGAEVRVEEDVVAARGAGS